MNAANEENVDRLLAVLNATNQLIRDAKRQKATDSQICHLIQDREEIQQKIKEIQ